MKKQFLLFVILAGILIFSACELDGFLFNTKKLDRYSLPANTIQSTQLEEVSFKSGAYTLYGYWVKATKDRPDLTILYCHGNKHHIDNYWDRVMYLHQLGGNIFIFDYRGYGKSEGDPSEQGMHEDAAAALNYVLSRSDVNPDSICLYGYSLGNVASIYLAAEKIDPFCLIAECPFASANALTQGSTILDIPAQWLTRGKFDNAENIQKTHSAMLLLHGDEDDFVRYRDNGKKVFEYAPEPKKLVVVPGAGHTDIPETMGIDQYLAIVGDWIHFAGQH